MISFTASTKNADLEAGKKTISLQRGTCDRVCRFFVEKSCGKSGFVSRMSCINSVSIIWSTIAIEMDDSSLVPHSFWNQARFAQTFGYFGEQRDVFDLK